MNLVAWHRNLVQNGPSRIVGYLAYVLLFPLSLVYGAITTLRATLYRSGWLQSYRSPVPVIAIGNLSAGGTGKTPLTDFLLRHLLGQSRRVAVVSRGYGRKNESEMVVVSAGNGSLVSPDEGGDEPVMLARRNPDAVVVVSADRKCAIEKAVKDFDAEVILLDDAYQHLKVKRDLNILLLDAKKPFGNGFPLPFGMLREFPSAVNRADIVILTRSSGDETLSVDDKPVLKLGYSLADYAVTKSGEQVSLNVLRSKKVGAFAGIADPGSFFESLRLSGVDLIESFSLNDHAEYSDNEIASLSRMSEKCDLLLTTEKDLVKLDRIKLKSDLMAVPLIVNFLDGNNKSSSLLDNFFEQYRERKMLDDSLVEILACPKCKGAITYEKEPERIVCASCKLAYPIRDGIPVMLVDEAEVLD
ncbi:MAG: tetraacyldisaccharide 4'-kinase [Desulfuromonas sp.]|nr:MAG: tetraacyldisaccharide 4'-kinase [Desulfuromonas sp.]